MIRGLSCAFLGYFAPFLILIPLFSVKHNWPSIGKLILGLVAWHWPLTEIGCALLIPNALCLLLFGFAGYKGSGVSEFLAPSGNAISLGVATLVGYCVMLVITYTIDPFRDSWGATAALAGSMFVLAFPLVLFGYSVTRRRFGDKAHYVPTENA